MESRPTQKGITAIDGALALIIILLVVQIWLLTATLEAYLAGHHTVVLPGLGVSAVLAAACVSLYGFVRRVDREVARPGSQGRD